MRRKEVEKIAEEKEGDKYVNHYTTNEETLH
jgi:hypothetical protein